MPFQEDMRSRNEIEKIKNERGAHAADHLSVSTTHIANRMSLLDAVYTMPNPLINSSPTSTSQFHELYSANRPSLLRSPSITHVNRPEYFHSHSADDIHALSQRTSSKPDQTQLFSTHLALGREISSYPDISQSSSTPFDRTPQLISDHTPRRIPTSNDPMFRSDFDEQISPQQQYLARSNVTPSSPSGSTQRPNLTTEVNDLVRRASAPSLARDARNARLVASQAVTRRRSGLSLRGQLPPGSFQMAPGPTSPYSITPNLSYRTPTEESFTPASSSSSAGEMEKLMSAAKLMDSDVKEGAGATWTPRSALRDPSATTYGSFDSGYSQPGWQANFQPQAPLSRPVFRQTLSSSNLPLFYPTDWTSSGLAYSIPQDSNQHISNFSSGRESPSSARPHSAPHVTASDYYRRFSADAVGGQASLHPPRVSSSLARNNLTRQSLPTLLTPPLNQVFDQPPASSSSTFPSNLLIPRKQTMDYSSDEFPFGHQLESNDHFAPGPKRRLSSFSDPPPPEPIPITATKPLSKKALAAEKAQAKRDLKNGKGGATRFVNYSQSDKKLLLSGVAPSGSSKRRRKEEMEAEEEDEE